MARYNYGSPTWLKVIGYVILSVFVLAALFCLAVLIYGGCEGTTFVETLQTWFTPDKLEEGAEAVQQTTTMLHFIK